MQPVAVMISYQDWQKIEKLLEPYLTPKKTASDSANKPPARRGRVFPEKQLSQEEIDRQMAVDAAFLERCHVVFDRLQPQLIKDRYDWFIVIEPDSGDYFKHSCKINYTYLLLNVMIS
jgi:hypothetical protein